jgi:hypothetical protein
LSDFGQSECSKALGMDSVSVAAENTTPVMRRSPTVRSKLANGKKLLPLTDGRSATARRFRDLFEDICIDLGGIEILSEGQKQLARRAAMLSAECERMEAMAVRDERGTPGQIAWKDEAPFRFDLDVYGQLCDRLGRLFQRLGLERKPRPINDGSTALASYFTRSPVAPIGRAKK